MTNIISHNEKLNGITLNSFELDLNSAMPLQLAILASLQDIDIEKMKHVGQQKAISSMNLPVNMPMTLIKGELQKFTEDLKAIRNGTFASLKLTVLGLNKEMISADDKLVLFTKLENATLVSQHSLERYNPVVTPVLERKQSEAPTSNVPSWAQMQKSLIHAQLQELLEQLDAMQKAGGEYPIAYIINVSIAIMATLSTQLEELTAKPLEAYQEISKRQAILKEKIEAIKRKELSNEPLTKEDFEGLQTAVKELDQAIEKLAEAYTFEDNDGNKIIVWPNDEIRDVYEKAKANVEMMKNEKIPGTDETFSEVDPGSNAALQALTRWASAANSDKPTGAFAEWDSGKNGAQGNAIMKIILDTEISTFTDRLNREAQLISTAQSMGQKQVEHAYSLMRGIIGNYISR